MKKRALALVWCSCDWVCLCFFLLCSLFRYKQQKPNGTKYYNTHPTIRIMRIEVSFFLLNSSKFSLNVHADYIYCLHFARTHYHWDAETRNMSEHFRHPRRCNNNNNNNNDNKYEEKFLISFSSVVHWVFAALILTSHNFSAFCIKSDMQRMLRARTVGLQSSCFAFPHIHLYDVKRAVGQMEMNTTFTFSEFIEASWKFIISSWNISALVSYFQLLDVNFIFFWKRSIDLVFWNATIFQFHRKYHISECMLIVQPKYSRQIYFNSNFIVL